jgi:hypothetical protein
MDVDTAFKNAGESWTEIEEKQLNKLYNEDKLNIMEIAKIHCRAPGGILSRLKKMNIINLRKNARGYSEYFKSDLYKQLVENNKQKYKNDLIEIKKTNEDNELNHIYKNLDYYNRKNEPWLDNELQEIKIEYEIKEMNISQIGYIHRRTPGSISYKLKNLGIITDTKLSRGYLDYKNSNLYKEIIESKYAEKGIIEEAKIKAKIDKKPDHTTSAEIINIQNDITELKKNVKEILRLINAIYDFETQ